MGAGALGEASEASNRLREAEQLLHSLLARGIMGNAARAYQSLGWACLLLGRLPEAHRLGGRAIELSACYLGFAAHSLHLLGDIEAHPDRLDPQSSESHYRKSLALAEQLAMRPLIAHCHLGLGKLHRRASNHAQAQEHLTIATAMYREMDMTYWLEQVTAETRQLG